MLEVLAFFSINLIAAMSPGPDFAVITRYALTGHRSSAYLCILGTAAALLIHVFYCLVGVAVFLQSSPALFRAVQVIGSLYLAYLGMRLLFTKKVIVEEKEEPKRKNAFFTGFVTNLLNPKATLFLLSLFTQFLTPKTSIGMKIGFGVAVPAACLAWFMPYAFLLTHSKIYPYLKRYQIAFVRVMGIILILLSLYILMGFSL